MREARRRARGQGRPDRPWLLHACLVAIACVAAVAGCGPTDSDYFGPNEPTRVRVPTTIGDAVYVGVILLYAHAGDTVHLESVEVDDLEGDAGVEAMVDILHGETRLIGGISESAIGDSIDLSRYAAVAGTTFDEGDGPVALAVRVTGTTSVHGFDGLTITFRLNEEEQVVVDRVPLRVSICTAPSHAEAVEICEPIRQEMLSPAPT